MPETFDQYVRFYIKFAVHWWNNIGPTGYVILLTLVAVAGYIMMMRGPKRLS
jgi:hypothetical protein